MSAMASGDRRKLRTYAAYNATGKPDRRTRDRRERYRRTAVSDRADDAYASVTAPGIHLSDALLPCTGAPDIASAIAGKRRFPAALSTAAASGYPHRFSDASKTDDVTAVVVPHGIHQALRRTDACYPADRSDRHRPRAYRGLRLSARHRGQSTERRRVEDILRFRRQRQQTNQYIGALKQLK